MWSRWSQIFLRSPVHSVSFPGSWGPFRHGIIVLFHVSRHFLALWQGSGIFPAVRFLLLLLHWPLERQIHKMRSYFFLLINTVSGLLAGIGWFVCISKSRRIIIIAIIIIIIIISLQFFFTKVINSELQWNLCDSKSPQFLRILLSILVDLNYGELSTASILLQISSLPTQFS